VAVRPKQKHLEPTHEALSSAFHSPAWPCWTRASGRLNVYIPGEDASSQKYSLLFCVEVRIPPSGGWLPGILAWEQCGPNRGSELSCSPCTQPHLRMSGTSNCSQSSQHDRLIEQQD